MNEDAAKKKTKFLGLSQNVITLSAVSFLNDLSSDMIFPFIPIFLTSVLGASSAFVGLVEGVADSTASILKIVSGRMADKTKRRKELVVMGYSFSAMAKPLLAFATRPFHVLGVRFLDRIGKGMRDAPRDALLSLSCEKKDVGRVFGFHRACDTMGAAVGPLIAFLVLPLIHNNLRTLFLFSFVASFIAVIILYVFARDVKDGAAMKDTGMHADTQHAHLREDDLRAGSGRLGLSFIIFVIAATIFSLGRASDAFLLLHAHSMGVIIALIPILYFTYNIVFALASTPAGILSDTIGHRNTFMIGMLIFSGTYMLFSLSHSLYMIWILFGVYGFYSAFTEGVGRAVVADLVGEQSRGTAYGIYNAATGIALLPASLIFGLIWDRYGAAASFHYGAVLSLISFFLFLLLRMYMGSNKRGGVLRQYVD